MYINECDFEELPGDLQDRVEEESDVNNFLFVCPFCGMHGIKKNGLTEFGSFIYECDNCDAEMSGSELILE